MKTVRFSPRRLFRWLSGRCLVCGRRMVHWTKTTRHLRYCSVECACYDNAFSVRADGGDSSVPDTFRNNHQQPKQKV